MAVSKYKDKSGKFHPIFAIGGNEVTIGRDNVVDSTKILVDPDAQALPMQPSDIDAMRRISPAVPGNLIMQNAQGDAVDAGVKAVDMATWVRLYNDNLLINGDLTNPINQRGQTEYSGYVYGIDRWLGGTNVLVGLESSNGLKVSYSGTISMTLQRQNIENYQALAGQTLTLTVKVKNVTGNISIYISDGNNTYRTSGITTNGIYSVTGEISSAPARLYVGISADSPCSFCPAYAKLELGDRFTGFYPTDPATELAKCQRYCLHTKYNRHRASFLDNNLVAISVPLTSTLRTIPTFSGNFSVQTLKGATQNDFILSGYGMGQNAMRINFTKTSHGLTDASVYLLGIFDAEIY